MYRNDLIYVGIVGHEAAKFTAEGEAGARALIRDLLRPENAVCVSGRSPLGGIDVWAEEEAAFLGRPTKIFPPSSNNWLHGFKPRNLQIAETSDHVHVLLADSFPATYRGRRFPYCYHCGTSDHIKSGACYTALRCRGGGTWHIIPNGITAGTA